MAAAARTSPTTSVERRRRSQPPRIARATPMTWKYLFMSNSTAPATTRLGTRKKATAQAARNARAGGRDATSASSPSRSGRPRFVRVEEEDRAEPLLEAAPPPSRATNRMAPRSRCRSAGPTTNGSASTIGARKSAASRSQPAPPPGAARHGVQQDEQVGRREEVEVERREERGQDARPGPCPAGRRPSETRTSSRTRRGAPAARTSWPGAGRARSPGSRRS